MRIRELDMLRGVAILLVLGRHMKVPDENVAAPLRWGFGVWYRIGWMGVDLFFVLSGFLVSSLLFLEYRKHGTLRVGRFLIRRGFKIYPAFIVLLAGTVAYTWFRGAWTTDFGFKMITELVYLQNYLPMYWAHTWSLAVEEHFYLLLSISLFTLVSVRGDEGTPFRVIVPAVPVVAIITLILRIATAFGAAYTDKTHVFPTHLRLDTLAIGVLLGYLYCFRSTALRAWLERWSWKVLASSALLLVPPFVFVVTESRFLITVGFLCIGVGFAGIVGHVVSRADTAEAKARIGMVRRALEVVGVYSYSIYLWHLAVQFWVMPTIHLADRFSAWSPSVAFLSDAAAYTILSVGIGIGASKLIEYPALALRDRWFPSRSGGVRDLGPVRPGRIVAAR